MTAIFKREISSYFTSPLGYVFLAVFYGFSGLFLWMNCLSSGRADMSGVFLLMFFVIMVLIPVLTMRTFSEERRQSTDRLNFSSPVSLFGIVFGKYIAAFAVFMCAAAVMLIYALFMATAVGKSGSQFGWAAFFGNFAAIVLMGAVFTAIDVFISSLTDNQMIAALGSIGANIAVCSFDIIGNYVSDENVKTVFDFLSVFGKYSEFTKGLFSLSSVIYFLSLAGIFVFFTTRVLERRRRA